MNSSTSVISNKKINIATSLFLVSLITFFCSILYYVLNLSINMKEIYDSFSSSLNVIIFIGCSFIPFLILFAFEFKLSSFDENLYSKTVKRIVHQKGVITSFTGILFAFALVPNLINGDIQYIKGIHFFEIFFSGYTFFLPMVISLLYFKNSLNSNLLPKLTRDILYSFILTIGLFLLFG